ncbi:hypothetical protein F4779DRAFT_334871 [Xylariaceae sp. FL0662B]|nr:hypothetical protein F4779DRAFT_334871 [Xylariaceae sp. FL0662B]
MFTATIIGYSLLVAPTATTKKHSKDSSNMKIEVSTSAAHTYTCIRSTPHPILLVVHLGCPPLRAMPAALYIPVRCSPPQLRSTASFQNPAPLCGCTWLFTVATLPSACESSVLRCCILQSGL